MADELELQARALNDADSKIRAGIRTYIEQNFSEEEIIERVQELYQEEQL